IYTPRSPSPHPPSFPTRRSSDLPVHHPPQYLPHCLHIRQYYHKLAPFSMLRKRVILATKSSPSRCIWPMQAQFSPMSNQTQSRPDRKSHTSELQSPDQLVFCLLL